VRGSCVNPCRHTWPLVARPFIGWLFTSVFVGF